MRLSTATQPELDDEHRIEIQLGDLGDVERERREAMEEVAERCGVERRWPRKPAMRRPDRPARDEVGRRRVGQGRDRRPMTAADELGQHAAEPERDQRAEDGICARRRR